MSDKHFQTPFSPVSYVLKNLFRDIRFVMTDIMKEGINHILNIQDICFSKVFH